MSETSEYKITVIGEGTFDVTLDMMPWQAKFLAGVIEILNDVADGVAYSSRIFMEEIKSE